MGPTNTSWTLWEDSNEQYLRTRIRELEAERMRLLEHALHLERVADVGVMTSALAHDLTNQLMCVMGSVELARAKGGTDDLAGGLSDVLGHAGRMHETLEAFLSFVRRRDDRVRPFPVAEMVAGVQRLIQPSARAHAVTLLSTTSTRAWVRADRQLVEQALVNLLMNALRAAADGGGRVALSATDVPAGCGGAPRVRISVRDTGPGISEEVRTRLFEPFVTGNAAAGGHGLGLYVVRRFVEHYGGRIDVDSSEAGTRFDVDLPAEEPANQAVQGA